MLGFLSCSFSCYICIHLIHATCPEGVSPIPGTFTKHLSCAQTVHGRHCCGVRGHKAHSRSLQPPRKINNSALECWLIPMGELPSVEANTRDRKRRRVGLRDTLGKKQRISAVGNK